MEKVFIKNRKGQKMAVVVDKTSNQKGLVFVMHGLSGYKEQPELQAFAEAFKKCEYTTILFDTTNSFGESDGLFENATTTGYYEDLEDVITWAKKQKWYEEPFCLGGCSTGGMCIIRYALKYPKEVKAIVPVSTLVTGKLHAEVAFTKDETRKWKESGKLEWKSHSGKDKRLLWSYMQDLLKQDILKDAHKIKVPVLIIIGEKDSGTPVEHQKLLYEKITSKKDFHIIKDAPHTFRVQNHLDEFKKIIINWVKNL